MSQEVAHRWFIAVELGAEWPAWMTELVGGSARRVVAQCEDELPERFAQRSLGLAATTHDIGGVLVLCNERADIAQSDITSLNAVVLTDESSSTIEQVDTIAMSDERLDPEAETGRILAKERFRDAFSLLPDREREIAVLLYVKNLTLAEIGEVLGVSESRVCQIHGQTKKKLRAALDQDAALFHLVA